MLKQFYAAPKIEGVFQPLHCVICIVCVAELSGPLRGANIEGWGVVTREK
jgi:hypothetical protein